MKVIDVPRYLFFLLLFLSLPVHSSRKGIIVKEVEKPEEEIKRSLFPDGFFFGTATSAYQVEGAYLEDDKSLSNWDVFCSQKGRIKNGENGNIADDHYHRYLEDIEIIHSLGVNAYRFSVAWARVLPRGTNGEVNPKGLEFYDKIIDNLLLRGIEPFVTIHQHDYPQEFEDRFGGWLSPLMQEEFIHFAEICFERFGDRVKYWTTINEPNFFAEQAYQRGIYPPARCSPPFGNCSAGNSDVEPLLVMHNMLLAHAKVAKLYHQHFQSKQSGMIGMVGHMYMFKPFSDNRHDQQAANRALVFNTAWMFDPLVFGDYPAEMHTFLGNNLPRFSRKEKSYLKDSVDFIAINHYSTLYAKDCIHSSCICTENSCLVGGDRAIGGFVLTTGVRDGVPIGDLTGCPRFFVVPNGMEDIIDYVKTRYHNKPMFVTENGYTEKKREDGKLIAFLHDVERIEFHKAYLASLAKAIRDGADVRGYFAWSLMDNFEWASGYSARLGMYYVDRQTLKRIPKLSSMWYKNFLINNSITLQENIGFYNPVQNYRKES